MIETTSYRRNNLDGDEVITINGKFYQKPIKELESIPFTMHCIYFVGDHFNN